LDRNLVLIVDDDKDTRRLIQTVLEQELGLETLTAEDGQEALNKIVENMPSLVLLDLALPGMDGLELASTLKSHVDTQAIPIIVLSGLGVAGERALALGCDAYLGKPFDVEQLKNRVRVILSRQVELQQAV
jgi:CheY-like chemotaxis protein